MSTDIVLHYLTGLAYLLLGGSIWWFLIKKKELNQYKTFYSLGILALIITQGLAIHLAMLHDGHIKINWSLGLSFTVWLGLMIYWIESNFIRVQGFLLILLPLSGFICFLAGLFPTADRSLMIVVNDNMFLTHLIISLFAYSLIAVGALQALLMTGLDRYLSHPQDFSQNPSLVAKVLDAQPPLLTQERILFRLIWIGFGLLTLSIGTGIFVSLDLTGQFLPRDHKTFFTLLSWCIFGTLLFGRLMWGWRGRIALRWTILGFGLLMLAYTGTRFIFEVLLTH